MYNEFYYTKIHVEEVTEKGKEPKVTVLEGCSFPLDNVEETIALPDGRRAIILKGGHEETVVRNIPAKNGKIIQDRSREWRRREIYLSPEDALRYRRVTERVVPMPGDGLVAEKKSPTKISPDKPSGEVVETTKNPE